MRPHANNNHDIFYLMQFFNNLCHLNCLFSKEVNQYEGYLLYVKFKTAHKGYSQNGYFQRGLLEKAFLKTAFSQNHYFQPAKVNVQIICQKCIANT